MKRDVMGNPFVFVTNFPEYVPAKNWQNRTKSDKNIAKIKVQTFLETQCSKNKPRIHLWQY